jgi:hypothetical protein
LALNSGIKTYQILANNNEVFIPSLSSILVAVLLRFDKRCSPKPFGQTKKWAGFWQISLYIMAIRVVEFSNGGTKLERSLHQNQHTQRKLLNFENWINGVLKIHYFHLLRKKNTSN